MSPELIPQDNSRRTDTVAGCHREENLADLPQF